MILFGASKGDYLGWSTLTGWIVQMVRVLVQNAKLEISGSTPGPVKVLFLIFFKDIELNWKWQLMNECF